MQEEGTKLARIVLSASARYNAAVVIRVPKGISPETLRDVSDRISSKMDPAAYIEDENYWISEGHVVDDVDDSTGQPADLEVTYKPEGGIGLLGASAVFPGHDFFSVDQTIRVSLDFSGDGRDGRFIGAFRGDTPLLLCKVHRVFDADPDKNLTRDPDGLPYKKGDWVPVIGGAWKTQLHAGLPVKTIDMVGTFLLAQVTPYAIPGNAYPGCFNHLHNISVENGEIIL